MRIISAISIFILIVVCCTLLALLFITDSMTWQLEQRKCLSVEYSAGGTFCTIRMDKPFHSIYVK